MAVDLVSLADPATTTRSRLPAECMQAALQLELAAQAHALIGQALAGDAESLRQLLSELKPVLTARAARTFARQRGAARAAGLELGDVVQEMWLFLLERDGQLLRAWEPTRGMSLINWVGFVCERALRGVLARRARFVGSAGEDELSLDRVGVDPLHALEARDELLRIVAPEGRAAQPCDATLAQVSTLCLDSASGAQLAAQLGISRSAVYSARARLARRARGALA